jgi:lipoyl-dependent peroxiredoxin
VTSFSTTKEVLYTGKPHTIGGRNGSVRADDGRLDVKLSSPGGEDAGTNPEQLFGAGWSACFIGAMGLAAGKRKIVLPADAAVDAEIDLVKSGENYFLQTRLNVSLPGLDHAMRAQSSIPHTRPAPIRRLLAATSMLF